jgi:hypothetical protein
MPDVLAVDEDVDVRAKAAKLVHHPMVHTRVGPAQRLQERGHVGALSGQFDPPRPTGVLPQRPWKV